MSETRQEILHEMNVKPTINPEEEVNRRTVFLANYLLETERKGFVLGISGGQDSLLAGYMAQTAVKSVVAQGGEASFHAVLLPYGEQKDRQDAEAACDFIEPDAVHDLQIGPTVDAFEGSYAETMDDPLADFDKGNVKARARMIAQYAIAGKYDLLVLGTDHAAEAVTGFFTKHGDGAADALPLSGLNKRQGRQMLEHIGAPSVFLDKKPTADLLDGAPGQTDETELGITYDQIDDYLEGKDVEPEAAEIIEARFEMTRHKRALPVAYEEASS